MSDKPRNIDCHEVAERLYEYLDGELDEHRHAEVQHHLDQCAQCLKLSGFESSFIAFLEARTRAQGAPEALKRRILDQVLFGGEPQGG